MDNKFGRRKWVKLWCEEWLDGTTRYEMDGIQRAFWVDLLAMAGRSRIPGVICAGTNEGGIVGYPLSKFQGLTPERLDIEKTFDLFQRNGKIRVEITAESPVKLFKVELVNWDRYQSEYERQKPYRTARKSRGLQPRLHDNSAKSYTTEGEGEKEERSEAEEACASGTAAAASPGIIPAFKSLEHEPFGSPEFQQRWARDYAQMGNGCFTDAMEKTIGACRDKKIPVPRVFFQIKRRVEEIETKNQFRGTPL